MNQYFSWFFSLSFIILIIPNFGINLITYLRIKTSIEAKYLIGLVLGLLIYFIFLLIFSILGIKILVSPIFLIIGGINFVKILKNKKLKTNLSKIKINYTLLILVALGTIVHLYRISTSGLLSPQGLNFYSTNARDGLWHTSLMVSLSKSFPPQNYSFGGDSLKNYHYFFNLLGSEFYRFFKLPIMDVYFRFFPILNSILLGSISYLYLIRLCKSKLTAYLTTILMYFGGSFGYIPPIFGLGNKWWESTFNSIQSVTNPVNQPLMTSFVLILVGLFLLDELIKNNSKIMLVVLGLIFGLIIGFKSYGGVLLLTCLAILAIYKIIFGKKYLLKIISFKLTN